MLLFRKCSGEFDAGRQTILEERTSDSGCNLLRVARCEHDGARHKKQAGGRADAGKSVRTAASALTAHHPLRVEDRDNPDERGGSKRERGVLVVAT